MPDLGFDSEMSRRNRRRTREANLAAPESAAAVAGHARSASPQSSLPQSLVPHSLRRWLLAGAAGLLIARPLVLSDGGPWLGEGQPFAMLWIVLAVLGRSVPSDKFGSRLVGPGSTARHCCFSAGGFAVRSADFKPAPRPTLNMLSDGGRMAIAFFLIRQLAPSRAESRESWPR